MERGKQFKRQRSVNRKKIEKEKKWKWGKN